jgi:CxxC motif-containing protein (DUF1111 family)
MLAGLLTGYAADTNSSTALPAIGESVQEDAHPPHPWRTLSPDEQAKFELGYEVFNTEWVPANTPSGRIDGLGPVYNSHSCDACHNSRRRGRGPRGDGEAPSDLVFQIGTLQPDGTVRRGTTEYGFVLNPVATKGFTAEARISIRYEDRVRALKDGTQVTLHLPHYTVDKLSGPPLPAHTVLLPRMPPPVQGSGLLELVPQSELDRIAAEQRRNGSVHNHLPGGRFGWQATEPTVASQIASAFSREMGLTTPLMSRIDCGSADMACQNAPNGGTPEVEAELFEAVLFFQKLHAVPVAQLVSESEPGTRLFLTLGCGECHRTTLRVIAPSAGAGTAAGSTVAKIHPYTDLLLHDLGPGLADRDIDDKLVHSEWRTAPLWGMHAVAVSGQPPRFLHDGRARSVEEAILWHDGEAWDARERFSALSQTDRRTLLEWMNEL